MSALPSFAPRATSVLAAVLLAFVVSCNKPREVKPQAQEKTHSPPQAAGQTAPATDVTAGEPDEKGTAAESAPAEEPAAEGKAKELPARKEKSEDEDLTERLKRLKFKARRDVVWCRTTVANIPSYSRALEKFEAEFAAWGMYRRVPIAPQVEAFEQQVRKLCGQLGLEVMFLESKEQKVKTRKVPDTIHGDRAWAFEDNDIRGIISVTVKTSVADEAAIESFRKALREMERLVLVRKIRPVAKTETLFNLELYYFLEERYPVHVIEAKDLGKEMRQTGIEVSVETAVQKDSIGYLQNASLSFKEFNSSLPRLNESMQLLSRSKFLEARSSFFRRKMEEVGIAPPSGN